MKKTMRLPFLSVFCLLVPLFALSATDKNQISNENPPDFNSISVTIGGSFPVTGTFPAFPQERAGQFLTRIYLNAKNQKGASERFQERNIVLKRFTGEKMTIDLFKFQATGDFAFNPYLKNEDLIIIPPENRELNFVSIVGAVIAPKTFSFVEGDRLSDAILFAQGIDPSFDGVTHALINRIDIDGNKEHEDTVAIADNPALHRGDRIKILAEEVLRKDYKVYVDGEVVYPGSVFITRNSTTIRKVIEKVGGFKPSADLNRAELLRGANVFRSTLFTEDYETLLMARMSKISEDDSAVFIADNKLRIQRGNGSINFARIFDEQSNDGNFIVKSGDYIMIPEKVDLVYVFGQVNAPGYIPLVKGKPVSYYLQNAGGVGTTAQKEIFLIKGKTRAWIDVSKDGSYTVESGDYIWAPKKPIRHLNYYLQQIGFLASIITSLATLILLFVQFSR
jgi:protein involved in polysaccharide export with SLBB domain